MTAPLDPVAGDGDPMRARGVRWLVLALLFCQTFFSYLDNQVLSVLAPVLREEFGMTNTHYSNILNCFFLSYTIMYVVGGRFMDKIGARAGMAIAGLCGSTASLLHALANSVFGLGFCRFLRASGEGPVSPGCAKTVSEWFPVKERGFATSVWLSGATIGATLAPVVVVWMYKLLGWRYTFFATGVAGYVWVALWLSLKKMWPPEMLARRKTEHHAIRHLFRERGLWGVMMLRFFLDPVWFFYIFWLPGYLVDDKGLTVMAAGLLAWIPFLAADVGTLAGGSLASWLQHRGWSVNRSHKSVMAVSAVMMMSSVAVPLLSVTWQYVAAMCVSIIGMQMFGSNNHVVPTQLFPSRIVGTVAGVVGGCAGISSMIFTRFIGVSVDMTGNYLIPFLVSGLFYPVMLLLALVVVGKIERPEAETGASAHV